MAKLKAQFRVANYKGNKVFKIVDATIKQGIELAVVDFLEFIDKRVPVDTGMAKGSFLGLADRYGVDLDLSDATSAVGYLDDGTKVIKDADLGKQQAQAAPYLRRRGTTYSFTFETFVYHYWLRDLTVVSGGRKTPWESFKYATAAFKRRFETYIKRNLTIAMAPQIVITEKGIRTEGPVNRRPR